MFFNFGLPNYPTSGKGVLSSAVVINKSILNNIYTDLSNKVSLLIYTQPFGIGHR